MFILDSSVQFSCSIVSDSLWPHGLQHARLPWPSLSPRVCSNSVHWVNDAIQPSHPLSPPSPPALSQALFKWVSSLHQVAKVLELQLQCQSFHWIFRVDFPRIDWFDLLVVRGTRESSPAPQFKSSNSLALSLLYGPTLTLIYDYWKSYTFDYMHLYQQSDVSIF